MKQQDMQGNQSLSGGGFLDTLGQMTGLILGMGRKIEHLENNHKKLIGHAKHTDEYLMSHVKKMQCKK